MKFSLFTEYKKVTIVSDSIAKYVTGIEGVQLQSFSGDTISRPVWEIAVHLAVACDVYDGVFCAVLFPTRCLG